jgi:MoaA/NifB/PqqE/SkfB family radical SAM enzyme
VTELPIFRSKTDHGTVKVPQLLRYEVIPEEVQRLKTEPSEIRALGLYLTPDCNLNCKHCLANVGKREGKELSTAKRISLIDEAFDAGARQLIISGAGEPFMDKGFWTVVDHAAELGMNSLVYSNTTLISGGVAQRIVETPGLSINAKKYSFDEDVSNSIFDGDYFKDVEAGLLNLMEAGMNAVDPSRLGIQCTILSLNLREIPDLLRWARKNNIVPQFNRLYVVGRAMNPEVASWAVTDAEYSTLAQELRRIDKDEFNIEWPEYWSTQSPILGGNCVRPSYWVAVDECGVVKGCNVDPKLKLGEVSEVGLDQFLHEHEDIIRLMRQSFGFNDCLMTKDLTKTH